MRPPLQTAREQLPLLLARRGPVSATALAAELGVSVATLHRMLPTLGEALMTRGAARRTRHALRRAWRGRLGDLPLFAIDREGRAHALGELALLRPQGSALALSADAPAALAGWPVPEASRDGWWDGLPYPLHDLRPQGYLGRQLARAQGAALGVGANPEAWSDDEIVWVLEQWGADGSGHLILGQTALARWQDRRLAPPTPLSEDALPAAYAALAEQAVAQGVPGSSAAGEFPKFPALREGPVALPPDSAGDTPHVLVKFSGADDSPAVRRWADLLACEHLALRAAARLPGVQAARSRVIRHAGRTFLEVERFDRHGLFGRSPLLSLGTLDAALVGSGSGDWVAVCARLVGLGLLDAEDLAAVRHLAWFGRLIANTDMHAGNLSFRAAGGRLQLAPVYDMLPMAYAPLPGGEVAPRDFTPPLPPPAERGPWLTACTAALAFWYQVTDEAWTSPAMQTIATRNAAALERARLLV